MQLWNFDPVNGSSVSFFGRFVRHRNSMAFPFCIRHYHVFQNIVPRDLRDGRVDSPEAWDLLRTADPDFLISESRSEWLEASEGRVYKDGQDSAFLERARDVARFVARRGITSMFSVGVGCAGLEYQIKRILPLVHLVCSEFAPESVTRLRKVFVEADEIVQFDARKDDWRCLTDHGDFISRICLMYRVDPQFTDAEWRAMFEKMASQQVETILFIPHGFLTLWGLLRRALQRVRWTLRREKPVFSGYLRTATTFESYWHGLYSQEEMTFGGLTGYLLVRLNAA